MSVKLVLREISLASRRLRMVFQAHCEMERPFARAPRIEAVFRNEYDNRQIAIPIHSYLPKKNDKSGKIWVADAKYSFHLRHVFTYGSWEKCRVYFNIEFDGKVYEQVPLVLKLRKTSFEVDDFEYGDDDDDSSAKSGKSAENERDDTYEIGDNYVDVSLSPPLVINPPEQPRLYQVILAFLMRVINAILGLMLVPWYCIYALGIMLLPTEIKDPALSKYSFWGKYVRYVFSRFMSFCRYSEGTNAAKRDIMKIMYKLSNRLHPRKKTILFLSNRRGDLTGNFEFVVEKLNKYPELKLDYWLNPEELHELAFKKVFSLGWKCGKAKIILLDDMVFYIRYMLIDQKTDIIQLWHACGAFKTFGFSRLSKLAGPKQRDKTHRDYDYAFVSSKHIAKYFAEGFGIAIEKVIPYGVARTDMFFDEKIKEEKRALFYKDYPELAGKKLVLFAPTFRGPGKRIARYGLRHFNPNKVIASLPDDYVLLIKHHPFVTREYKIALVNKGRIYDFSKNSEINDLLFVTDVLITDYSSVIYEASLLDIPMIFYAFDLEDYISERDFYFEYEISVPGKIVKNQEDIVRAILDEDYEHEKVKAFRERNFDDVDGQSSERIAQFIRYLAVGKKKTDK